MPGLVGVVGDMPPEARDKLLRNMAQALKHEDWYQVYLYADEAVGLGRVSLGILNPEPQPIWNEDHTLCIVMEGEVYGYEDEKRRLIERGHRFAVGNDVEYVLHLYEEYGEDFALKLNGAFVAAIWEPRVRRLLIINDRLGLRPLYYTQQNGKLLFAAGVRALLSCPYPARRVDLLALAEFLSLEYVLGDKTLLTDVHLFPPASLLAYHRGRLTIRPYWKLAFADTYPMQDEETIIEGVLYHLRQAVARQMRDDGIIGVMLSGGLDSRFILALMGEQEQSVRTFTFGIPGCDDARSAWEVATRVGTSHHFLELEPGYLLEMGEEGVCLTDGMSSCAHMHVLGNLRQEAESVQILYLGFLGDALMGAHLHRDLWASYDEESFTRLLFQRTNVLFTEKEQAELFGEEVYRRVKGTVFASFQAVLEESNGILIADRQNCYDLHQRQRRFILNGHELLRSRLAVRTPFCDKDLVDFMLTVPPGLRLERRILVTALQRAFPELAKIPYEGTGLPLTSCFRDLCIRADRQIRWWLRAAGLKVVPEQRHRPYADYNTWMRTVLRPWVEDTLLSKRALERGYFNPGYIRNLVAGHMVGANHARKLGVLLTLELWHQLFLD